MSNKQTSIEWLIKQIKDWLPDHFNEVFEQTKAMHKEEMKQTYFDGWHRNIGNRDEDFEQYYTETYGKE